MNGTDKNFRNTEPALSVPPKLTNGIEKSHTVRQKGFFLSGKPVFLCYSQRAQSYGGFLFYAARPAKKERTKRPMAAVTVLKHGFFSRSKTGAHPDKQLRNDSIQFPFVFFMNSVFLYKFSEFSALLFTFQSSYGIIFYMTSL